MLRDETKPDVNIGELRRQFEGFSFDKLHESACAVRYTGVIVQNPQFPVGDPRRDPYEKIVNDLAERYELPEDTKQNMLNGHLAKESHQLHFDFKFTKGAPGKFYFGKFMAQNIGNEIDAVFLFYHMDFKFSPDTIRKETEHKFLWWTTHSTYSFEKKDKEMTEKDWEGFKICIKMIMFDKLNERIRILALEDAED